MNNYKIMENCTAIATAIQRLLMTKQKMKIIKTQ